LNILAWNNLLSDALRVIRSTNPQRNVIIGPTEWNNLEMLSQLILPPDDHHIIVTYHYYNPFQFTHQGAEWVTGSTSWQGTKWTGSNSENAAVVKDFGRVAAWAKINNRPIYMGEFGAYSKADMESRVMWTTFIARQAEKHGFSWSYWEFCAGFGAYDPALNQWRVPLRVALVEK
jgi:endoglucanase